MSSLSTKVNKSRSPGSSKVRATKAKKSASKKPQRPGKITAAPKNKKVASAKEKKPSTAKKAVQGKKTVKSKAAKVVAKAKPKKVSPKKTAGRRPVAKVRPAAKAAPPAPKKPPAPGTLAAVRAFEQALKAFNRHDYDTAKSAFADILKKFGEEGEIIAGVRTYMAIIEQRLARTPSVPRNPDALYNQGVFELNRGNIREAIDLFDKALRAEPRADHVLYSIASSYALLNDPSKALDSLRRAIAIRSVHRSHARRDPDFTSLHNNEDFQQLTGFGFDFAEE
jgi:tetratricopeptide (TPR) repeat protein